MEFLGEVVAINLDQQRQIVAVVKLDPKASERIHPGVCVISQLVDSSEVRSEDDGKIREEGKK